MESGKSLNPSSLFDLKAELHKKYESFRKVGEKEKELGKPSSLKLKNEPVRKQKNIIPSTKPAEIDIEEDLALQKSQKALEAKAKLYEKIMNQRELIDEEINEQYMVNFNRKILYEPVESNNKSKTPEKQSCEVTDDQNLNNNAFPKQMPKDESAVETEDEKPIHYQDIQYNEIRDHGVGYFAFSTNEDERKKQMEEFKSMRQETEESILVSQRMQRKRKAILEARLAKVCERRNIDKNVISAYTTNTDEHQTDNAVENVDLTSIPMPIISAEVEKKETKIRPWDVGKTDFERYIPKKHKIKTQNDWIGERRADRPTEFAPPSSYKF